MSIEGIRLMRLSAQDLATMRAMLGMMGRAFDDIATYTSAQPDDAYLRGLLGSNQFVAIAATCVHALETSPPK